MSQENVDFVRGLLDGAVDMDKQAILAALPEFVAQAFTEDAEWIEDPQRADRQVWRGHDGICESWRRWLDQWDEYRFDVTAIEDHGKNVFVAAREEARGSASGAAVAADNYIVVSFREGKIARYQEFYDEARARAALGEAAPSTD
jgi:ketosteroid isomerase-like protein